MSGHAFTVPDLLARNALLYPDETAVVSGEERLTFKALEEQSNRCAAGLAARGVSPGDRIAVLSDSSSAFLVLLGGAAKIGAMVVPVNSRLGDEEMAYILRDTEAGWLAVGPGYGEQSRRMVSQTPFPLKRLVLGNEGDGNAMTWSELLQAGVETPPGSGTADAPYLIIHTAASGGRPRGAILTQANLLACGVQIVSMLSITREDCHIGLLPLFHIGGLAMTTAVLLQGGKNVLVPRFVPAVARQCIACERGTFFVTFPPMLAALLDEQEKSGDGMPSLRLAAGVDSTKRSKGSSEFNSKAAFCSLYGQTEVMPVSGALFRERPGSIGRPAMLTRVALHDDLDREVPPGVPGEICVRSPAVFQGYWNLASYTARVFRNGWHHTGDLGRLDEKGFLWYAGRKPKRISSNPGRKHLSRRGGAGPS
jgi:long-chain acyl-CoA synthetase